MIANRAEAYLRDRRRIATRLNLAKEKTMPKAAAASDPGHNSELTEEHRRALFFHHLGRIKRQKEVVATATADLRNIYKVAKAEGFSKKDVDFAISIEATDDEILIQERRRQAMIARWMQAPLGLQGDLLDAVDLSPAADRAREAGKIAGMKGQTCIAPYADGASEQAQAWIAGWHMGQETLMAALTLTKDGVALIKAEDAAGAQADIEDHAPFGEDLPEANRAMEA